MGRSRKFDTQRSEKTVQWKNMDNFSPIIVLTSDVFGECGDLTSLRCLGDC